MVRIDSIWKVGVVGLLACMCGLGCGSSHKVPPANPSAKNLDDILWAYARATTALGYGPRNKDELAPFFKVEPDPDEPDRPVRSVDVANVYRSPNDDQDYVIDWGFDIRELDRNPKYWPVIAYEKSGQNGKRYVIQGRYVRLVTDEDLADLPFPEGFKRP